MERGWSSAIRTALSVLKAVRERSLRAPTHERLRWDNLGREDIPLVLRWRAEIARKMGMQVGRDTRMYSLNVISEPYLVELGDNVIVSGNVTFVTNDGGVYLLRDAIPNVQGSYGRIKIGNNCFIGMGAIVLPNVQIGNNCVVAAGSVVHRSFGADSVIMGNPATTVLSFDMYRSIRCDSAFTVTSDEYPFPMLMPERAQRELIEQRLRGLPLPAPRASKNDWRGA
jgi:acetyltransferase-like isoleucine patch superfamily enzyme